MLEICCFSLQSCLTAEQAGAGRIELCGGMFEGGTTPSAGLLQLAIQQTNIPIYCMIRPRGGDFCYSNLEFEVMQQDILFAKNQEAKGVVFGILLPDGSIDKTRTKALVALAKPMKVTFHRAFDMAQNPLQALEDIIDCGCERILTSGQKNTAIEGLNLLAELVKQANNRIEIMAGSGVNATNAQAFLNIGIKALHLTGKATQTSQMLYKQADISMASLSQDNEYEIYEADLGKCQAVVEILQQADL